MVCIYCGQETQVNNSRLQKRLNRVWRRRTCSSCRNTFTTHEKTDLGTSVAVRYSARDLRPFSRDTLFISLYECCKHRPEPVRDADGLTQTISRLLLETMQQGTLQRQDIILVTRQVLDRFDSTAATVYAAFHPLDKA